MDLRTRACFEISRKLMKPPQTRTVDYVVYHNWRETELKKSWSNFTNSAVTDKDVLDFGCGDGHLAIYLMGKKPRSMTGVDLTPEAIERAKQNAAGTACEFVVGSVDGLPFPDLSFDTVLAFECMEHIMQPQKILNEWYRVLRQGGRCLIEWFPYKGAWGPHMEALIPIPWAHVLFGEKAMFRAAEAIYDLPEFVPRRWDLEDGKKKPNKWRSWSSFDEQGYINKLDVPTFKRMVWNAGFEIARIDRRGFSGPSWRRLIGRILMNLPAVGEYFLVSTLIELVKHA